MELRHLRYFVAVAEQLNFTHAAEKLHVAQPALSNQIKDLEEELQTPLFQRGRRGVQLTRSGKIVYQRARSILAEASEAANEARTAAGLITGTLVLGFPSGLHLNYLAETIRRFRRQNPKVEFNYYHALPVQQIKALREGRIDIAFLTMPARLEGFEYQVVWRVPFKVVLPTEHPLARRKDFELGDLRGEDFVFCTRESRPEFYDEFFRQCANTGFQPRIVTEVGGYGTNMLGLISVGVGISVLPHFERAERITGLTWRPLTKPKMWVEFALVWRAQASAVARQFAAAAARDFPIAQDPDRAEI